MSVTLSNRNAPQQTQGTVEPIKMQISTHGASRSQVGMLPRSQPTVVNPETNQTASTELIPQVQQTGTEVTKQSEDQISSKFAALARKEKALRQQQAAIAAKEQEIRQYQEEAQKAKLYRERLKSDPLDVLNEEGITYDQLVQRAINPANQEVTALQRQVTALEESVKRQQEEAQKSYQTQRQQAERQISMDVKSLISSDPAFETVKDIGADEAVTQLIVSTYDEDGVLLTTDQAAKQVEEYLQEEAKRIMSIPAIKKRLSPIAEQPAPQQQAAQSAVQTGTRTLSHSAASSIEAPARTWAQKKAQIVAKYSKK